MLTQSQYSFFINSKRSLICVICIEKHTMYYVSTYEGICYDSIIRR